MTPERNVLSWLWIAFMVGLIGLYGVLLVRVIAASDDSARELRLACMGLLAGVGLVHLTSVGFDYLYRRRTRVWLAIAPNPITNIVIAAAFFLLVVDPLRGGLAGAYLIGAALWLQREYSTFLRQEEEDLRELLGDPTEDE